MSKPCLDGASNGCGLRMTVRRNRSKPKAKTHVSRQRGDRWLLIGWLCRASGFGFWPALPARQLASLASRKRAGERERAARKEPFRRNDACAASGQRRNPTRSKAANPPDGHMLTPDSPPFSASGNEERGTGSRLSYQRAFNSSVATCSRSYTKSRRSEALVILRCSSSHGQHRRAPI